MAVKAQWRNIFLAGLMVLFTSCGSGEEKKTSVYDLNLPDLQGVSVSLAQFQGRVVMLNFWATWCPPCRDEIPDFVELQDELGSKGLVIIGISMDSDSPAEVQRFSQTNRINYKVLYAGDMVEETVKLVGGFRGIPTTFLLDRQGKVVKKISGAAPKEMWAKLVSKLL